MLSDNLYYDPHCQKQNPHDNRSMFVEVSFVNELMLFYEVKLMVKHAHEWVHTLLEVK